MIIGVLSFLIGLIAFLFFVYPRLSVLPGESLDLHMPFQTPFIVKNDGYWPLMDVNYDLTIEKMETINGCNLINCGVSGIATKIPKLRINESSTIYINRAVGAPADEAICSRLAVSLWVGAHYSSQSSHTPISPFSHISSTSSMVRIPSNE